MSPLSNLLQLSAYIAEFAKLFPSLEKQSPWEVVANLPSITNRQLALLSSDFKISGSVAIHQTAVVEEHVILKGPVIISARAFVGAHAYLRQGVFLGEDARIGPGCEVKSSWIFSQSALAHFNFIGDSLLGSEVNLEAGSIIANHHNDRISKLIDVVHDGRTIATGLEKFGAIVGDRTKIGANAVLSPGTLLPKDSIVHRLALIEQLRQGIE